MADIYIRENTTTDDIRRQLSDFRWFSTVEASIEQTNGGKKIVVLHEVTLGQRLTRLFQRVDEREKSVARSLRAIHQLADTRPAFRALLGSSISNNAEWAAKELHRALTRQLEWLVPAERGKQRSVPLKENGQVGVAGTRIMDIQSDSKVSWGLKPKGITHPVTVADPSKTRSYVEVTAVLSSNPSDEEMKSAYMGTLMAASGHVVIAPIKDFRGDGNPPCSDRSILLLLEAIDNAKLANSQLTAITIAAREYGDPDLAGRIEDIQAARKAPASINPIHTESGRFNPPHSHQVPGIAGVHFLTNSPFDLQAGRTIVPRSVAESEGYSYVAEDGCASLPKLDTGRLIAFDDRGIDQVQSDSPAKFGARFSKMLENMAGTVVIYPPPNATAEQLKAMMSAVIDTCEKNRSLSVSFATEDANQREAMTNAYVAAKQEKQEAQDLDIDADPEEEIIVSAELWKKA